MFRTNWFHSFPSSGAAVVLLAVTTSLTAHSAPATGSVWGAVTSRASVGSSGQPANDESHSPAISTGGRYIAFVSRAANLVAGDTNVSPDVFVRDRLAGTTRRVSVGPGGRQADGSSYVPSISADGRFVAFVSEATNLVAGDTNGSSDIFVRDLLAGVTWRASVGPGGRQGDLGSFNSGLSRHGRYVVFTSAATNLVAGDSNGMSDVFVHDRLTGVTRRISIGPEGVQTNNSSFNPVISADGRYVAFGSWATNLVAADTNGATDVFVRDRLTQMTRLVSVGAEGRQGDGDSDLPAISGNGRYVAFTSWTSNLVDGDSNGYGDVLIRDRRARTTTRVSAGPADRQGNNNSAYPAISEDGRYVAFFSSASNLVARDANGSADYFVRDRVTGLTRRASVTAGGQEPNGPIYAWGGFWAPALSGDGRHIAFASEATDLVPGDTNPYPDVFVRDRFGD